MDKLNNYNISETDRNTLLIQSPTINNREVEVPQEPYLTINGAGTLTTIPI